MRPNQRLELSGPRSASAAAENDILNDAAASAWAPQLKRRTLGRYTKFTRRW